MSPEAQRIAIAEACGAKWICTHRPSVEGDVLTEQRVLTFKKVYHRMLNESMMIGQIVGRDIPNYPADLNAMHEAEKLLKLTGPWIEYVKSLGRIFMRDLNAKGTWELQNSRSEDAITRGIINFVRAAAAQRAEAFLRAMEKWVD